MKTFKLSFDNFTYAKDECLCINKYFKRYAIKISEWNLCIRSSTSFVTRRDIS